MNWLELNAEGAVVNIIVWDGVSPHVSEGVVQLLPCDDNPGASFGWKFVDGIWEAPPLPEDKEQAQEGGN